MAEGLHRGYATSSADTGHVGGSGSFALGHPEKLIDFGYRSEHEMAVKAKRIINAFYGNTPQFSYWNGCSTGGRQGLREAQSYTTDFDGIMAGAPANPRTHLAGWGVYVGQSALKDKANTIPATKLPMIHQAVVGTCDALDGVKEGLIEDPTKCKFDFKALACKLDDADSAHSIFVLLYPRSRPHRLAARTWPSQGQNTGSIPVGATSPIFVNTVLVFFAT
jgi:feruloyl esterase